MGAFRAAAAALLGDSKALTLEGLLAEHAMLAKRIECFGDCHDALEIWQRLGVEHAEQVTDMESDQMQNLLSDNAMEAA